MKKLIVGLTIGFLLSSGIAYAVTASQLYRQFGSKLLHAIVFVIKDEINILRAEHGLSARTNEQVMNSIQNKLDTIPNYAWQN